MNTSPPTFLGLLRPEKKSKSSHLILHFRCELAVSQDRVASTCFSGQKCGLPPLLRSLAEEQCDGKPFIGITPEVTANFCLFKVCGRCTKQNNNFQHDIILNKSRTQSTRIAGFHTIGFIGMSLFTRPPQVVQ